MCTSNCDPVPTNDFLQDLGDGRLSLDEDRLGGPPAAAAPRSTGPSAATACTLLCTVTLFTMTIRPFFRPSLWYTVRSSSTSSYVSSSDPSRNPPPAAAPGANRQNRALDACPTSPTYPLWFVRGLWSWRAEPAPSLRGINVRGRCVRSSSVRRLTAFGRAHRRRGQTVLSSFYYSVPPAFSTIARRLIWWFFHVFTYFLSHVLMSYRHYKYIGRKLSVIRWWLMTGTFSYI